MITTTSRFTAQPWVPGWPPLLLISFLGYFEANALEKAPFHPHIWLQYIDDIFMIWTDGSDKT